MKKLAVMRRQRSPVHDHLPCTYVSNQRRCRSER
jgi:hypothetical protein